MTAQDETNRADFTRRRFLASTGTNSAALAAGVGLLSSLQRVPAQPSAEKIVLPLIGAGGRSAAHASGMSQIEGMLQSICDIWNDRGAGVMTDLTRTQKRIPERIIDMWQAFDDKEVNAVVIATPELWHALVTVRACQAGKDIYVEKNPSMSVWEGRKMIEAARKYNRIVQVSFQNRSGPYAAAARDYIASGKPRRSVHVKVYNMLSGSKWEPRPDSDPPGGFDWDAWLGPAPAVPYNRGRHLDWHP